MRTTNYKLELDNAFLKQQNELLTKELSFTRYTINALKNIANQKDTTINETRLELEKALQHIQFLSFAMKSYRLSGIGLIDDTSSSEEGEEEEEIMPVVTSRPSMGIIEKLPLRHHNTTGIYIHHQEDY